MEKLEALLASSGAIVSAIVIIFLFVWAVLLFLLPIYVYVIKRVLDKVLAELKQMNIILHAQRRIEVRQPAKPSRP